MHGGTIMGHGIKFHDIPAALFIHDRGDHIVLVFLISDTPHPFPAYGGPNQGIVRRAQDPSLLFQEINLMGGAFHGFLQYFFIHTDENTSHLFVNIPVINQLSLYGEHIDRRIRGRHRIFDGLVHLYSLLQKIHAAVHPEALGGGGGQAVIINTAAVCREYSQACHILIAVADMLQLPAEVDFHRFPVFPACIQAFHHFNDIVVGAEIVQERIVFFQGEGQALV